MEIVISPLAKGYGYASALNYTHSSDLKTMQEIFHVGPLLGDAAAAGTLDLSDMFLPNTIPTSVWLAGDYNHNGDGRRGRLHGVARCARLDERLACQW